MKNIIIIFMVTNFRKLMKMYLTGDQEGFKKLIIGNNAIVLINRDYMGVEKYTQYTCR